MRNNIIFSAKKASRILMEQPPRPPVKTPKQVPPPPPVKREVPPPPPVRREAPPPPVKRSGRL